MYKTELGKVRRMRNITISPNNNILLVTGPISDIHLKRYIF